ncbi:MAG: hypothetical protein ACRDF6_09055 [bacterium]
MMRSRPAGGHEFDGCRAGGTKGRPARSGGRPGSHYVVHKDYPASGTGPGRDRALQILETLRAVQPGLIPPRSPAQEARDLKPTGFRDAAGEQLAMIETALRSSSPHAGYPRHEVAPQTHAVDGGRHRPHERRGGIPATSHLEIENKPPRRILVDTRGQNPIQAGDHTVIAGLDVKGTPTAGVGRMPAAPYTAGGNYDLGNESSHPPTLMGRSDTLI